MKTRDIVIAALALAAISTNALAACVGTAAFSTCTDNSGNQYTVSRMDGMTNVQGSNAQTGSQWSQQSNTLGNMTITNGMTNGRSWNETQTQYGNGFGNVQGMDSHGHPYNYNCAPYTGCQ